MVGFLIPYNSILMKTGFMRMKVFSKRIIIFIIVLITVVTACVKSNTTPGITPGSTTITGIIKVATNLTFLDSAMSKAGLLGTLDSAGPYTLFAPVNIAFVNAGFTDSTIYKYSKDSLRTLMAYHIYAGYAKKVADLPQGPNAKLTTLLGDSIFVTVSGNNVFINGNLITQNDIIASNGIIHALSGLLIPSYGYNIFQALQNLSVTTDTTLQFFVAALDRASSSTIYPNIDTLLSSGGIFSIFAPTNAAFIALGYTTIDVINNSNPDTLSRIMQCHLLNGRVFSSDFPQSGTLISIAGDSLAFETTFSLTVLSKGDSSVAANITSVNRIATNGVIHKIDKILLP